MQRKTAAFLFIILLLPALYPGSVRGWGGENHRIITGQVMAALPQWELDILGTYADSVTSRYCLIPDYYRSPDYKDAYAPYIEIPYLPASALYHKSEDPMADIYIFTYFAEKAVRYLKEGNIREAALHIGTLTHFIEDNSCPVHVVDNGLLVKLVPPPSSFPDFSVHGDAEGPLMRPGMVPSAPERIGESVRESVYPFMDRFLAMQDNGRAQAVPIVQAIYAYDDIRTNLERVKAAEPAVKLTADVIHTIFCIAYGR